MNAHNFSALITKTVRGQKSKSRSDVQPNTVVLDGSRLLAAKTLLTKDCSQLKTALDRLTCHADNWLSKGPWSVVDKSIIPPSGSKHDYASQAPYWWPSPNSSGLPYVQHDGVRNPSVDKYTDHGNRRDMFQATLTLTLAWYYTSKQAYAVHAGNILRTWFISTDTMMKPNLNHAQCIPGLNSGRYIGIIDFSQGYTSVLDAAAILATGAPGWTKQDAERFHSWNVEFLDWLQNSEFGIKESAAKNNHGTFAIMQKAAIALFVGFEETARHEILTLQARIEDDFLPDGSQPAELSRTRSWHYSTFNLMAYTRAAEIGLKIGVDLWDYKGSRGQSIHAAVEYLIPAARGDATWSYAERDFKAFSAWDIIHAAADRGNVMAKLALGNLQPPPDGDLWALRPAAEQLDIVRS
jgi:hypothetical protein